MSKKQLILCMFLITGLFCQKVYRDDFNNLEQWDSLIFPKIETHSRYEIVEIDNNSFLKASSNASASGVVWQQVFNPFETPVFEWQWKIENVFNKGDASTKEGDDYPIRLYIIFEYDPDMAGLFESVMYESAKLFYGEYPPHSSLNYIWANKSHDKKIIPNAYTDKAMMFILQEGNIKAGKWVTEEINILEDYKKAFGEDPPEKASVAIMADSDNTGESGNAFINYIEIRSK